MRMARKRKIGYEEMSEDLERKEMMELTKMAKAWEFTCSFCFKKFPSAQAMGGHQNAHRQERMEERRLYIKDPIGYRKRAYIKSMNIKEAAAAQPSGPKQVFKFQFLNINNNNAPPHNGLVEFNASAAAASSSVNNNTYNNKNYFCQPAFVVMNFLPPKELSLVNTVGGKARMEIDGVGGSGVYSELEKKLDLTLKL
ncbi:zinc finger protein [Striga asiatica]|uniref:Zinc finger protein n=1 Tax=Striga asiatica TaxID=4170 RepID=A0A5A7NZM6_STRAF|nr:zinc finger protein [Striga asiatica]